MHPGAGAYGEGGHEVLELFKRLHADGQTILMVTHNIEEAVEMADRILIFSSDPGRISAEIPHPHPAG